MSLFDGVGRNPADVKDKLIESVQRERPGSHLCVDLGRSPLVQAGSRKYPFSLISWEPPVNQISPMGLCCLSPSSEFAAQTVRRTRKGRQMSWYRAGCALALAGFLASSCNVADNSNAASTHLTNSQSQSGHDPALSNDADGHHDAKPSGEEEFNSATTDAKFEFADWVPERGPADTSDPDFELPRVCDLISENQYQRAGLIDSHGPSSASHGFKFSTCFKEIDKELQPSFSQQPVDGLLGITIDRGSILELEREQLIVSPTFNSPIPGLHAHRFLDGNGCAVGIETVEGRLYVDYTNIEPGRTFEDNCRIAHEYFDRLITK